MVGETASPDVLNERPNTSSSIAETPPSPSGHGLFFTLKTPSGASFSASQSGLFVPLTTVADDVD